MTNEEKGLLLKDLCARLPYGVIVKYKSMKGEGTVKLGYDNITYVSALGRGWWTECKPYLRPMESMTEDERNELSKILNYEFYIDYDFGLVAEDDRHRIRLELCEDYIDWLNERHFDYRGLIPMGLALPAKEGMYNIK